MIQLSIQGIGHRITADDDYSLSTWDRYVSYSRIKLNDLGPVVWD